MRILLICALDVWSLDQGKGAPTLERTLRAYGEARPHVDAVMPDIGANHFYRGRDQRATKRRSRGPTIPNVTLPHVPHAEPARPAAAVAARRRSRRSTRSCGSRSAFPWLAAKQRRALLRTRDAPYDVIYAYEVHGVLAARLLRRRGFRLPLVTRFQGTVMHPALTDRCCTTAGTRRRSL